LSDVLEYLTSHQYSEDAIASIDRYRETYGI
jgi:hypothetical protein